MAGGEGARLRPLTSRLPKPLVPVVGTPVLEHILRLLKEHGITQVVVTLAYLGAEIRNRLGDGAELDMEIEYVVEDRPLGTAGSVRNAAHLLDDTFLVISGAALTDIDLTTVMRAHEERGSHATIVLHSVPNPLEYGVVVTDDEGNIKRFLEKPRGVDELVQSIRERLTTGAPPAPSAVEDVASILERETQSTIDNWLRSVRLYCDAIPVRLSDQERCAHLPRLFRDLIYRLRFPLHLGSRALVSAAAAQHGLLRRQQGYTAAMLVEESRMLQVSIFQTLQNNLPRIDFSVLLVGVMAIADEVDSQLAQQMVSYISESVSEGIPPLLANQRVGAQAASQPQHESWFRRSKDRPA